MLNINNVLLCDDVRREDNGKFIVIGAYTSSIILPSFPGIFMPVFFVVLDGDSSDKSTNLEFEVKFDNPDFKKGSKLVMPPNDLGTVLALRAAEPIPIGGTGEVQLYLKLDEADWFCAMTKRVTAVLEASSLQ